MRQVIQRRKRGAVSKFRRSLHHAGFTVRATVGDLEHAARLSTELARHRFQVGMINHRERWDSAGPAGPGRAVLELPEAAEMPAHWLVAGAARRRWYATARCTKDRFWPAWPHRIRAAELPMPSAEAAPGTGCLPALRSRGAHALGPQC